MQRLIPPFLLLLWVLAMIVLAWLCPIDLLIPSPWNWLGALLLLGGLALSASLARRFAQLQTEIHTFREPGSLVTDGAFARSRNPIYVGFSTALAGVGVLLGSICALAVVPLYVLIVDRWYIRHEESALQDKFGASYDAYRARVRRWL